MNIKFNPKNKKNIITIGILIVCAVLVYQFVYFPKARQLKRLDAEYKGVSRDIDELYSFIGGQDKLEQNIIRMRRELALLEKAFPSETEVSNIVRRINDEAKRFKINVISLKPRNLFVYKDTEGKELKVSDYFCKCMPLRLDVESRYRPLGEFLAMLEANKDPMISVVKVEIKKDREIAPRIKAEIELNTFMLGK